MFRRGLVLGIVATIAGLVLQCASDKRIVDAWLTDLGRLADGRPDGKNRDSIGPTAEAAPNGVTRQVFTGKFDAGGKATICGLPGSPSDPPAVTWWVSYSGIYWNQTMPPLILQSNGCGQVDQGTSVAGKDYKLVVVY